MACGNVRRWLRPCAVILWLTARWAAAGSDEGLVSTTLGNGLRVTILADDSNPVVATQMWYHVGSAHEDPAGRGLAYLFTHLMAGTTRSHGAAPMTRYLHDHGGRQRATSWFDETVFSTQVGPGHHRRVLELEADRMTGLVIDSSALAAAQKTASEELRLTTENLPFIRLQVSALKAVLGEHPYARSPVGTRDAVNAATVEKCVRFHERYFCPSNAHLVIVGPVDGTEKLAEVREIFTPISRGRGAPPEVPQILGLKLPTQTVELTEDLPPAEIAIFAYALPAAGGKDHWALEILRQMLTEGTVDPLNEELVARRRKAIFARVHWLPTRRGGAVLFTAGYVPYRRQSTGLKLMQSSVEELSRFRWLSEESLASARTALTRRELERVYFADRRAGAIGRAAWWLGDPRLAMDTGARLENVGREDIKAVFDRYIADADPVKIYVNPEHVPLWVRLFGWVYPVVS